MGAVTTCDCARRWRHPTRRPSQPAQPPPVAPTKLLLPGIDVRSRGTRMRMVPLFALSSSPVLVPFAMPHLREEARAPSPAIRLPITAPDGVRIEAGSVVSPDGRFVAFRASRPGENVKRWIRPLDTLEAIELRERDPKTSRSGSIFRLS